MQPTIKFLDKSLLEQIVSEATHILCKLGVDVQNKTVLSLLADHGAQVDMEKMHVIFTEDVIEKALQTVPKSFKLYNVHGDETHNFYGQQVYFTPGSSALKILDPHTGKMRKPVTADYANYAKVVSQLKNIASQSTAMIPTDVPESISDSYRLFLSLLYCEKPVVTGAFSIAGFEIMKNLQLTVRGTEKALMEKPLAIFTCCPTSPLRWSDLTSQNLFDCARYAISVLSGHEGGANALAARVATVLNAEAVITTATDTNKNL
ncbi:MAG: trimethylamine methyltransferase family protein, partial [bacterium]